MRAYPFSAIVGHDQLRLALILCAVRPEIGGVLIRGEKGTAKSTAVRGLAALLSSASDPAGVEAHLVELPIGRETRSAAANQQQAAGAAPLGQVDRAEPASPAAPEAKFGFSMEWAFPLSARWEN